MSFNEGADCSLSWQLDTTGKWTSFSVDLMSGSNTAMNTVQNVLKDRDGTKGPTSYTFKCPKVTPNSAIYFYQFTQTGADTAWTTRFTINDPSGQSTPPTNPTQPDGKAIPWGIGALASAAGAGAAPTPAGANATTSSPASNMTVLTNPPSSGNVTASTPSTSSPRNVSDTASDSGSNSSSSAPTQSTSSGTGSARKSSSSSSSSSTTSTNATSSTAGSNAPTTSGAGRVCAPLALAGALMGASVIFGC